MSRQPRPGFDLSDAHEDTVTHELYEALADRIFDKGIVAGFDRQLFECPVREPKVRNVARSSLDKMPDLWFRLVRSEIALASQDGIFVECKPVDEDHTVGKHYCDRGLHRFVCGDYAWAMTTALMVGYAQAGYTLVPKLDEALRARPKLATRDYPFPCSHSPGSPISDAVHMTRHERSFIYAETGGAAPAIVIRHLWLRRG